VAILLTDQFIGNVEAVPPRVRVLPSDIAFEVADGESVIAAAWRNGLYWPTVCEGQGNCRACVLAVVDGAASLSPIESWEREGLDQITPTLAGDPAAYRLACQARPAGDVVVRKVGVRTATLPSDG
jgi:ferredoxin, 2Fe-2S